MRTRPGPVRSDALWSNTGNWSGGAIPGTGDIAIFDALSSSLTNNATSLNQTFTIKGLKIVDPATAVSIATGNTLTLDASGIDMSTATQNLSIAAPLVLGVAQSWNVQTGRTATVSASISGSALTKAGAGAVTLSGTNTFAGPTLVTGGTLTFSTTSDATPGTGFDISNNALVSIGYTTGATGDNIGTLAYSGTGGTLTSTINSTRTISTGSVTVASGASGIFNAGGGRCIINDNGTATGAGTFRVNIGTNVVGAPDSRHDFNGNWTGFTGTLEANGTVNNSTLKLKANGSGANFNSDLSKATVVLSSAAGTFNFAYLSATGGTIRIGALSGSASTNLTLATGSGAGTFRIGEKNLSTTFDGTITNGATTASVDKRGTGVLTLTGTNTHTGTTTVTEGVLKYNGAKTGAGSTAVNTGATLAGTGSLAGTTSINTGGTLAPGDAGTGNLSFANLTLNSGSILKLGATPTANKAVVQAAGTLTLASGISVDVNGFSTDGTYDIIDITGANPPSGSAATSLTAINTSGGKLYTFASTTTAITMTISSFNYWNVDGDGSWNAIGNWSKGVIPNGIGAIAKVGPGVGGAGGVFTPTELAITLDADQKVGVFAVETDRASTLTINPGTPAGTLSFDNGAASSNLTGILGDVVINAPISVDPEGLIVDVSQRIYVAPDVSWSRPFDDLNGVVSGSSASIAKSGLGTLVLAGDNTYGGGTIISAGNVKINTATSLGDSAGAATFTGGTLQLANALTGITRSFRVSGTSSAIIDTNGFSLGYDGVISPVGGGTGGLIKTGGGTMTLTAAQTYTVPPT